MKRLIVILLVLGSFHARAETLGLPPAITVSPRLLNILLLDRCIRAIGGAVDADERKLLDLLTQARDHIAVNNADAALQDAERLLAAEPNSSVALIYRAVAEHAMKKWKPAIKDLDNAIAPNRTSKSILALAYYMRAEYRLSESSLSLNDVNLAIAANPNLAPAYSYRGYLFEGEMEYSKARADLDRAIALDPEEPYGYVVRSNFRYQHDSEASAISDLDRAIELNPQDPLSHWLRGRILFYKGDRNAADRDFERASTIFLEMEAR